MVEIDGGHLEGGGQILRTAVGLSAVTAEPVHISHIRKGRDKPGLRPQHLHGIAAAGQICNAECQGLKMNSTEVTFNPGRISGGTYLIDTRTAGSVTLVLQTLVPIAICANSPVELIIRGGTAVPFSPSIDYFRHVFCSMLGMYGVSMELEVRHHGFYPKGGGEVFARIIPSDMRVFRLKYRGSVNKIRVWITASNHLKTAKVAERILDGFSMVFSDPDLTLSYVDASSPGCFITACACCDHSMIGASALGKRGRPAEEVGQNAADSLKKAIETDASVDVWMVDQLIPFMALATHRTGGSSEVCIPSLTKHAQTNIWVTQKFLGVSFSMEKDVLKCTKIHEY
ncbi:MAG: RNA 3'-terminal phosphate cyclase [candidate division WOR-3 bacterium]|nr:MAG: RNA 3'-terminal phosphate cyclase [candidate division WOR-3 bacterium]